MKISTVFSVLTLFTGRFVVSVQKGTETDSDTTSDQCTLYLAPSAIDNGHHNLGMYAGVNIPPKTKIGTPELAIPLIDLDLHNGRPEKDVSEGFFQTQSDQFWNANIIGAIYEIYGHPSDSDEVRFGGGGILAAIPGIGSLGGEHPSKINADFDESSLLGRKFEESEEGISYPARGAYSNYFNITLTSTDFIPQGMQIFANTGKEYDYTSVENLKQIDYDDADALLLKIDGFLEKHRDSLTPEETKSLYSFFINDVISIVGTEGVNSDKDRGDKHSFIEAVLKAFPEDPSEIEEVKRLGGTFEYSNPELRHDIEWLKTNGQCMDGLHVKRSTISNAGRGAFATRDVSSGGLIAPVPLLLIDDRKWMDMREASFKNANDGRKYATRNRRVNRIKHQQLLSNYCFGHSESSLLFFPYGVGVNSINHKNSKEGANAKIVWTKHSYHDESLHDLSLDQLLNNDDSHVNFKFGFDIVATRDIKADEEIFLDYGPEWEEAWKFHVEGWNNDRVWPTKAMDLNTKIASTDPILTKADGGSAYGTQIMTACHFEKEPLAEDDDSEKKIDGKEVFQFPKTSSLIIQHLHACEILDRKTVTAEDGTTKDLYTVHFLPESNEGDVIVKDYPREGIRFLDKPYTSDQHSIQSFRHSIGIPDEIFPEKWRDLK